MRIAAEAKIAGKTKPLGSLGRIESLAVQLSVLQNTLNPDPAPVRVLIFAADHGVSAEAVSLYPASVTAQMMHNFAAGGAAINVLARQINASLEAIDVGVNADLFGLSGIVHAKIAQGSGNIAKAPAMQEKELDLALAQGFQAVLRAQQVGVKMLVLGDMGIGNTTSSAALLCALLNRPASEIVGAGTGVRGAQLKHKCGVVEQALQRFAASGHERHSVREILRQLGGLEIAALVGAVMQAHTARICVLVDGFIVTVAALIAVRLLQETGVQDPSMHLVFSHRSAEQAHGLALGALHAEPLLNLGLRLGEGSGAALAYPLLQAAAAIMREMASFADAGVDEALG